MAAALEQPRAVPERTAVRCVACDGLLGPPRRFGAVSLARCGTCGTRTAVPRPTPADVAALHDSEAYHEKRYFEARRGRVDAAERRFRRVASVVGRTKPSLDLAGRRLLDVGCDTGEFPAAAARVAGVVPFGVEVADRSLAAARAAGIEMFHGDLAAAPAEFADFALITAIDVLEHVADPGSLLREAVKRLAPDGAVYLETPNWRSLVYALGRGLAKVPRANASRALDRLFPPEHVQYFTRDGLTRLAAAAALKPLALFARPLAHDAVAGSAALRVALDVLQLPDRAVREEILLCALLEPA